MHRFGERVGHQDVGYPACHRPAKRFGRTRDIAQHRLVGDVEATDLGAAAVVTPNRRFVDLAARVGHQLRTGRGELPDVGADRVKQCGHGVIVDLDPQSAEFGADEGRPLCCLGDLGALVGLRSQVA